MNALDRKLIETEPIKLRNWVKLVSVLKTQLNIWTMEKLNQAGYDDFKVVYMPVLMNITSEGINNNELAWHARVTKQAMSKVARELQKRGYIRTKTDPRDKRSTIISLTERGKKLVIQARESVCGLEADYRKQVDPDEFEKATEILRTIVAYNDRVLLNRK